MVAFDITDRPVEDLGVVAPSTAAWTNSDFFYDWAIAGLPFLDARSPQQPFERYTSPIRKQQFDTTQEVGEQSLEGWWLRSQSTFHGGAGMKYLDSVINGGIGRYLDQSTGALDGRRFYISAGVDVWTPGIVQLLKTTTLKKSAGSSCQVVGAVQGGADCFFQNNAGTVTREDGSSTSITGWSGTVTWIATNGSKLFGASVLGIDAVAVTGTTASALWTQASGTAPKIWWVKQRLIAARGPALYELALGGGNLDTATPFYTHPDASWVWTSVVDAPASLLASGYSGADSTIYKFVLDDSGAIPTLSGAMISADLPGGELVKGMYCYLGSYVAIGTNRGVRIGVVDSGGDVTYGPLTIKDVEVSQFTGKDRFIFCGYTNAIDGNSGLARIDLGTDVEAGRYAWATDLQAHVTGTVTSVSQYGASGRLVFSIDNSGSYLEHATNLETSGYLQTAFVRYGTMEPKLFKLVRVRTESLDGDLTVSVIDRNLAESSLYTIPHGTTFADEIGMSLPPEEFVALKFVLQRAGGDATKGSSFSSYQLKALPAVPRKEILEIYLEAYDHEEDRYGRKRGAEGQGSSRFRQLRDQVQDGDVVLVQDLNTGENLIAVVEELRMASVVPPGKKNPGAGVFKATVRTV